MTMPWTQSSDRRGEVIRFIFEVFFVVAVEKRVGRDSKWLELVSLQRWHMGEAATQVAAELPTVVLPHKPTNPRLKESQRHGQRRKYLCLRLRLRQMLF